MGKLSFGRVLDSLCLSITGANSACLCIGSDQQHLGNQGDEEVEERQPLVQSKNVDDEGPQTLASILKPKMVKLRVSMHCNGCARKVQRHVAKIEGVTSYELDLETNMVVVIGDIVPYEVLESVSKVKPAEFWPETKQSLADEVNN